MRLQVKPLEIVELHSGRHPIAERARLNMAIGTGPVPF
jgi:hypothetical protein